MGIHSIQVVIGTSRVGIHVPDVLSYCYDRLSSSVIDLLII